MRNNILDLVTLSILILTIFIVAACGGQTRGTGGSSMTAAQFTITGKLIGVNQLPIENVTVIVLETGASAVTDQNGLFVILTDKLNSYTLAVEDVLIEGINNSYQIVISEIPEGATETNVDLQINSENEISMKNT